MMIRKIHVLLIAAVSLLLLLVAMPGFAQTATPNPANEFELTGTVTALTTTTLTINGITIQITGAEIDDPISLGTLAKVHYTVNANGVRVAREVEQARAVGVNNPGNNNNNNDLENEIVGVVSAISGSTVTVDNQVFQISNAEFKTAVMVGTLVKIHYSVAADGTLVAREIEQSFGVDSDDDDRNDDRNDDRGGSSNSSSNNSSSNSGNNSSGNSSSNSGSGSGDDDRNDDHGGNSGHGRDDDDDRSGNSGHGSDDDHDDDRGGNSGHGSDDD